MKQDYVTLRLPTSLAYHLIITDTVDRLHPCQHDLYYIIGAIAAIERIDIKMSSLANPQFEGTD